MRERLRQLAFGAATVFGVAQRGFFIPYRYANLVMPDSYPALQPFFEAAEPSFAAVLAAIEEHRSDLLAISVGDGPARFDQDWFPRLDAAAAYVMVRRGSPRLIVEIGSGHSTRFLARGVADGSLATDIICVDPAPRVDIAALNVHHERRLLSEADPHLIQALRARDILFIDSSHIAMPGTDVDRLFLDILPRLADGVLIHVHDIFLPDRYPPEWRWRGYNEQLLAGVLIQGGYEIVFASHYVVSRRAELIERSVVGRLPLVPGARETSLWVRKVGAALGAQHPTHKSRSS